MKHIIKLALIVVAVAAFVTSIPSVTLAAPIKVEM